MGKYDDIIGLPHHTSTVHPRMSRRDRAAQFLPFAALTGYDDTIKESARRTEKRREHDEQRVCELDGKLRHLAAYISEKPEVEVEYFVPDAYKDGGSYQTHLGTVKKIDFYAKKLIFCYGTDVEFENIRQLHSEIFCGGEFNE